MSLPYNKNLIPRAKELRREMTKQEKRLWYDFLRSYPIRFQRQKTIDSYIVDFYCHEGKLVIEVDGKQHYTEESVVYDAVRAEILNSLELSVIRFSNDDVENKFGDVCREIDECVKSALPPSPSAPPPSEREA